VGVVRSWLDQLAPNNREPNYADSLGRLHWQISDQTSLTAQYLWSRDRLAISDPDRGETADIDSASRYLWLRGDTLLGERWRASVWLGSTVSHSNRSGRLNNPGIAQGTVRDQRAADLWDLKLVLSRDLDPRRHLELGADWQVGDGDYDYQSSRQFPAVVAAAYGVPQSATRVQTLAPFRRDFALYGTYRIRVTDRLTSELGLRVQRAAGLGLGSNVVLDPRIALDHAFSEQTHLRVSWGRFHQLDEVQELRIEDGALGFALPQHSDQFIIGIEYMTRRGLVWRGEAYQKTQADPRPRFENALNPLAILAELAPDRILLRPSSAKIRGVEWSAARNARPWSWRVAYSYSQAFDELAGEDVPRAWDQTHAVNASIEWQRRRWSVSAALTLHSGWPTTALTDGGPGAFSVGARNTERWPWFRSLDLHASYRRPLRSGELVFSIDVANALDTRNRCCAELVSATATGSAAILEPLTWTQRVPTLGLRWEF
jgi:outer membrane cobalamin receptor